MGYVAFGEGCIHHLGVLADQHSPRLRLGAAGVRQPGDVLRRRYREAVLWVLIDNEAARAFYRAHGWTETEERRRSEYPALPRGR